MHSPAGYGFRHAQPAKSPLVRRQVWRRDQVIHLFIFLIDIVFLLDLQSIEYFSVDIFYPIIWNASRKARRSSQTISLTMSIVKLMMMLYSWVDFVVYVNDRNSQKLRETRKVKWSKDDWASRLCVVTAVFEWLIFLWCDGSQSVINGSKFLSSPRAHRIISFD